MINKTMASEYRLSALMCNLYLIESMVREDTLEFILNIIWADYFIKNVTQIFFQRSGQYCERRVYLLLKKLVSKYLNINIGMK